MDLANIGRESFIADFFDDNLPNAKPKARLVACELEPTGAKYWPFLKPDQESDNWYIDVVIAVGRSVDDLDDDDRKDMRIAANGIGATVRFITWRKEGSMPKTVPKECVDMMLFSEGTIARLGKRRLELFFKFAKQTLKRRGRLYFVVNPEDERTLDGTMDVAIGGGIDDTVMTEYGFDIVISKRDHGVAVGYMQKSSTAQASAVRARLYKPRKRPRAY